MHQIHDGGDGNTAPFVSFLTTAYQTEQYVSETIESVLAQTRGDWELIVVDNGNSDEMARIIGNYTSDPRITLIRQDNKGYVGGVSAAAAVAEGRYLCVLDSDDAVQPNYCERIGALIDADPGIDAVGCNAMLFCEPDDGQKPGEYFALIGRKAAPDPSRSATFTELLNEGVPPYVGTIRREAWDALGGYESSADVEPDVVLWLRLASTGRDVRILPDTLIRSRRRAIVVVHGSGKYRRVRRTAATVVRPGRRGARPQRKRRSHGRDATSAALPPLVAQGQIGTARRRRAGRA